MRTILTGLFVVSLSYVLNAQLQNGGSHAGFAIDADTKVGFSKFGPTTATTFNNDDWFLPQTYSGIGVGVIDTTGASVYKSKLQSNNNISFTERMSKPMFSVVNNKLWIDAIYARDFSQNLGGIGSADSSSFSNSAKNVLNPNTNWQGTSTNFTVKTDLVDGFAHLRRDGTSVYDSLWMFFGVSTLGTNGDRYYDVELFKKACNYDPITRLFNTAGPDGGHTSWQFDAAGKVTQTGDMIISFTFSPGVPPQIDLRLWVSNATYSTVNPYYFNFDGVFDGSGSYGYAQIVSNSGGTSWGSGIGNYSNNPTSDTTYATPWGTSTYPTGTNIWSQNYQQLQFVEVGLNLSRIGIDAAMYTAQGINPCESTFASVLFKSRSSSSFTSNLQDFLGPLDFKQPSVPSYTKSSPILNCNNLTGQINISNTNGAGNYKWSTRNGNIIGSNTDSTQLTINAGGTYYLSVAPYAGCNAMRTDTIVVIKDIVQPLATAWFSNDLYLTQLKLYGGSAYQPNVYGGSQGITWDWSGPSGFTANEPAPLTSFVTGTYQLILTEARNGCKDTATVWVDLSVLATNEISLSASKINGKVSLQWQLQAAKSNGSFIIEKGISPTNFTNIGSTKATSERNSYNFTDPSVTNSVSYYRIRFVQENGKIMYSNTVKLSNTSDENIINIIPQKNASSIIVSGATGSKGMVTTVLYGLSGNKIETKTIKNSTGNFATNIIYPVSSSPAVYILTVYIDGSIVTSKKLFL
ncbi:MAG: hypothetical protein HYX40_02580 [Sphingobacteriales bacterium]|nr:hypothetical protein [Sphingobacteriales bacterium]